MTTTSASQGYRTINPATGELLKSFDNATDQQIADALDASQAAYEQWSQKSVALVARPRAAMMRVSGSKESSPAPDASRASSTEMRSCPDRPYADSPYARP